MWSAATSRGRQQRQVLGSKVKCSADPVGSSKVRWSAANSSGRQHHVFGRSGGSKVRWSARQQSAVVGTKVNGRAQSQVFGRSGERQQSAVVGTKVSGREQSQVLGRSGGQQQSPVVSSKVKWSAAKPSGRAERDFAPGRGRFCPGQREIGSGQRKILLREDGDFCSGQRVILV